MRYSSKFHAGGDPVFDSVLAEEAGILALSWYFHTPTYSLGDLMEAGAGEQFCRAQPTGKQLCGARAARTCYGGQDRGARGGPAAI